MKNKSLLLLVVIIIATTSATHAQIKCKIDLDKVDSFSGARIIVTKSYTIGKFENSNKGLFAIMALSDGNYFLRAYTSLDMGCASSRSKIALKTTQGGIVELDHVGDIDCGKHTSAYSQIPPILTVHLADTLREKDYSIIRIQFEKWGNVILDRTSIIKELCDCLRTAEEGQVPTK
jgi:hypothetical protein